MIAAARAKEYASYKSYGQYSEVKEALQAATMWNYIYTPAEYGPFMPVSRQVSLSPELLLSSISLGVLCAPM